MGAAEQNFTWIIKKPDLFYKSGFLYYLLNQKENRLAFASRFVLALPIFPASHPASIVGEGVLNFCVRDGNRWTHTPINTNFLSSQVYPEN